MIAVTVIGFIRTGYPTAVKLSDESSAAFRDSWFYQVKNREFRLRGGLKEGRQWITAFGKSCRSLRLELRFCFYIEPDMFRNMLVIVVVEKIMGKPRAARA